MGDRKLKIEQRIFHQLVRALLLISIALLQTSLAPSLWRFRADWVLVAVISWSLLRGLMPGMRWAIYGGFALDILGVSLIGSHLFALMVCVLVVVFLTEPLDREQPALLIVCILGASLLYNSILAFIQSWAFAAVPWVESVLLVIVPTALLNTIVAIPVFALLRRFERRGRHVIEA